MTRSIRTRPFDLPNPLHADFIRHFWSLFWYKKRFQMNFSLELDWLPKKNPTKTTVRCHQEPSFSQTSARQRIPISYGPQFLYGWSLKEMFLGGIWLMKSRISVLLHVTFLIQENLVPMTIDILTSFFKIGKNPKIIKNHKKVFRK